LFVDPKDIISSARQLTSLADRDPGNALEMLGHFIDAAGDLWDGDAARHAVALSDTIDANALSPAQACELHLFRANAWSNVRRASALLTGSGWQWEQKEVEKEVLHYRAAMRGPGFGDLQADRKCQILTNAGNAINFTGRFVEAPELYDEALRLEPAFGHAHGNRAICIEEYARTLYDSGHRAVFLREAHRGLATAAESDLDPAAKAGFAQLRDRIASVIPPAYLINGIDLENFSLGDSDEEIAYRRWCGTEHLFLNPLNDLGPYPIAARDILGTPSMVGDLETGPYFQGFFNQLKQEYCSARWMLFEGHKKEPHFSDKEMLLYDTLDHPAYSLSLEQAKLAFRAGYSIFDKIAFFLNAYDNLHIPERQVSFRTLWYKDQKRAKGIRDEFAARENLPWRGLFWLGKDLHENRADFLDVMDPDARGLAEMRNHLEHKYLQLHDDKWHEVNSVAGATPVNYTIVRSVGRSAFLGSALRILKLARASLIYLSLGIEIEERNRAAQRKAGQPVLKLQLGVIKDRLSN
jgi:hypothetical protein